MATTSTGVKITVDTSDIDIKFLKSVDQLNASLTKSQRALKLSYNEQGLLTNALGQTVEGLTISQIKLGQYVDGLGKVRTFQDGYTEGLSKTQIALGMYADELGNVHNAMGEVIGLTDKAAKAMEKEAAEAAKAAAKELEELRKSAEKSAEKLVEIGKGIETATAQLAGLGSNLRGLGESLHSDTLKKAGTLIDTLIQARAAGKSLKELGLCITEVYSRLVKAGSAAKAFQTILGKIGSPFGVLLTSLAAIQLIVDKIDPLEEIQPLSEEFKKIEEHAKRAGESIKNFSDVLKHGAFAEPVDEFTEAANKMKDAKAALDKARDEQKALDASSILWLA